MRRLYGHNEILYCYETYQFSDYSKYDINLFSEEERRERREKVFPEDLQKAYHLGIRLVNNARAKWNPEFDWENHQKLLEILADAWKNLNASELLKYIHPEFQYDSQKVLASMYANEYHDYITGKFNTIRKCGSIIDVSIVKDPYFGGNMIRLTQDKNNLAYLRIKTTAGKIYKMDMCMF